MRRWNHYGGCDPTISSAHVEFAGDQFLTFEMFGDFSKVLENNRGARATQRALEVQHDRHFHPIDVEGLKRQAIAFYAAKNASKAA
jgi:hypothetical protein